MAVSLSAADAVRMADWYARFALDSLEPADHPGVRGHLVAAVTQIGASVQLLKPDE